MKFYNNKNIIVGGSLVLSTLIYLVLSGNLTLFNRYGGSKPHLTTALVEHAEAGPTTHTLIAAIKQEEAALWQEMATQGLTEKAFTDYQTKYYRPQKATVDKAVSAPTVALIQKIGNDFGLTPQDYSIKKYVDEISPAAAEQKTIFIDEYLFNTYSEAEKHFIIAHEFQHIILSDDCLGDLADKKLDEKNRKDPNHLLNRLHRFQEKRADTYATTRNALYAEGEISFIGKFMKLYGNKPSLHHPLKSDRILLAQNALNTFA